VKNEARSFSVFYFALYTLNSSLKLWPSPKTHLITNARSSLQGGAVLVWLMGDTSLIREDAKLYFRKSTKEPPPKTPDAEHSVQNQ